MTHLFSDRRDAGRTLAATLLVKHVFPSEPVVLALPRGGVPVAFEVAEAFKAPLDVCMTQSLEVPGHSGLSMGAVASGQVLVLQQAVIERFQIPEKVITRAVRREARELGRRERAYRGECAPIPLADRTVILVDDGLVSVAAAVAAITAIRARRATRLVLAMPVASRDCCARLLALVDELVCLATPTPFQTVATWYREFPQVSDLDVRLLHGEARHRAQHWSFPH
ncbi:MAG TPA: hypothetical protein VFK05_32795 [Polyangiaceae bacterium]|nr:hypothetical protein [Polyangiaceae bacterium]